jgi:hypothetical protein
MHACDSIHDAVIPQFYYMAGAATKIHGRTFENSIASTIGGGNRYV